VIEPEAALVAIRFAGNLAALLLWGASCFVSLLVPAPLRDRVWEEIRIWRFGSLLTIAAAALLALPVSAALVGGRWLDAADPSVLAAVALETSAGTAWLWQAASAFLLLVASLVLPAKLRLPLTALFSAGLLLPLTLTGHAVMQAGAALVLHQANDLLHVLAGGFWIGALVPVLALLRHLATPETHDGARVALSRFSLVGHGAVALVLVSGLVNTVLILGRLPTDWSIPYQRLLSAKIVVVVMMITAALFNRYYLVPRLGRSVSAARALTAGTIFELVGATVVVGLVAWFGTLDPLP